MSNALHDEVLRGLAELCDRSRITGICANCNGPIEGQALHLCDPDRAGSGMIAASWRTLLEGTSPMKRAASYRVG